MATENLKVKITADASQAKAEIGKFKAVLKKTSDEAEGSNSKMKVLKTALDSVKATAKENVAAQSGLASSLGKVAVAAGGLAITLKTIKGLVKNAINVAAIGDEIKDNAQKVFMGTTAYQEWGYVLKQNGVEMSALKVGMRQFAQQVATGSENLAKYGITAQDVDTAFQQAVYTIQNMSTETEKIAAATELFGTRALELFPVLNLTNAETQNLMATYRAIGGTMSNELIAASDKCTDSILEMKMAWGGLRNLLAAYVIPVVTKVVQWITVAIAKVRILLAAILGTKETFTGGGRKKSMVGTSASVATNIGNTANNLKKASKHAKELRRTLMGIDELSRLAEKATASAASGDSGGGGGGGSVPTVSVGDPGTFDGIISEDTLQKIQTFQEKVDNVRDKLHGAYLILKGVTELVFGNPVQGFKDIKEGIELMFPGIEKLKEKWADLKEKIADKVLTAKIWIEDHLSSAAETVKTKWAEVKEKVGDKVATARAYLEDKVSGAWSKISPVWEKAKQVKGTMSATLKLKLKNSFTKAWNKVKKAWNSIRDKDATISLSFKNLITKGWNAVAKKVNEGRQKSKLVAGLFPDPLPTFANGGVLTAPTAAIMGEYPGAKSNPEIATPQSLMYETIQRANGDLVSAFAQMTRQVVAAIEDKDMDVRIGDEQIARSAQRGNTAYKSRTGKALLSV